ncbi:unnamed protein product [Camellia sinensis]
MVSLLTENGNTKDDLRLPTDDALLPTENSSHDWVIDRSFGFDIAVEEAQRAINAAHVEAESVENGVGVVKLMGRYSGFIAMYATLASRDVGCCLIPESPFFLEVVVDVIDIGEHVLKLVNFVVWKCWKRLSEQRRKKLQAKEAELRRREQDVYMYFRGSGKAAEMKREAAKRTMMAALP